MKAGLNGISAQVSRAGDFSGMRTCSSGPENGISRPPGTAPPTPIVGQRAGAALAENDEAFNR